MNDSKLALRAARQTIVAELRSCDKLSRSARLRYERALRSSEATPLDAGVYQCAHGRWLYKVCTKCGRGPDEALNYALGMTAKLKELLAILNG